MMDVLHYMYEEDLQFSTEGELRVRSSVRESVYSFYGREYPYKFVSQTPRSSSDRAYIDHEDSVIDPPADTMKPFDPRAEPVKAYVPATDFDPTSDNPFAGVLDGPAG